MKTLLLSVFVTAFALIVSCTPPGRQEKTAEQKELPSEVLYPADYRSWTHVKSMVLEPGHPLYESFGGIHHIYANAEAMQGYRSGTFPDGSVIVFDLLEALRKDSAVSEGNRKVIGVMYKNSNVFTETGGWGFGGFSDQKGTRVQLDAKSACFNCHAGRKDFDYVFSSYRP
ncbi:MAG: cytochrome P460 family protein [Chitinophagales bacterium]|nr:cytochrome P460 family protein [Chitinophagales bacterium]MDW8394080.1 cytochrome P460 family protein [Chitinophagales bacterium]